MAELIATLLWGALGIVILLALLLYKLCEWVLPPLGRELAQMWDEAETGIRNWWREVTWERDVKRIHQETIGQIDAAREENVELCRKMVVIIEEQARQTAGRTAAVESAVAPAVRTE